MAWCRQPGNHYPNRPVNKNVTYDRQMVKWKDICTRQQSSEVTLAPLDIALAPIMESAGRHETRESGMPSSEAHTCITWRKIRMGNQMIKSMPFMPMAWWRKESRYQQLIQFVWNTLFHVRDCSSERLINLQQVKHSTENKRLSIWQLCRCWWHRKLALRQLTVPQGTTKLSNWQPFDIWRPLLFQMCTSTRKRM